MPTTVIFEAGTIADCMKRAARVAPSKAGSAFDKAAGIVFDIDPTSETPCVIRATDTETFYLETLDTVKAEGEKVRWRLPSQLLAGVVGTVPATTGKTVKFSHDGKSVIEISSGRMKVKLVLNGNPYYPEWDATDNLLLRTAPNFGGNITRVEWAAAKEGSPPLSGIHIDGQYIIATDRYRVARVPCQIDLPGGPVTIPAFSIGQLMRQMGDVLVGVEDNSFIVMPDDFTQIRTIVFGSTYAPVDKVTSLAYPERISFRKTELIDKVQKAVQFAGSDRNPVVTLYIGREELAVFLNNDEIGLFGDVIELTGQAEHARTAIRFSPKMLLDALNNAPNEKVSFEYDPGRINLPAHLDGDSGYEVWMAPRAEKTPEQ